MIKFIKTIIYNLIVKTFRWGQIQSKFEINKTRNTCSWKIYLWC